jgi:phosphate:Na+ symporter
MNTTLTLMDLAGAVALLIWGVHMVQTGITRAYGPQLRRTLGYALGNRFRAFLAGLGATSILQSSTATGLMVTAFRRWRACQSGAGAGRHAGRQCRYHADRQVLSFDVSRVRFCSF